MLIMFSELLKKHLERRSFLISKTRRYRASAGLWKLERSECRMIVPNNLHDLMNFSGGEIFNILGVPY